MRFLSKFLKIPTAPRKVGSIAVWVVFGVPLICNSAELVVKVAGVSQPLGQIGCSLFATPNGFPMDTSTARSQWQPADAKGVTCRFSDLSAGKYAVSVGHDLNGNQKVDTNFIGMPTEQWGVSNNVRPSLRAPRYDEAVF